MGGRSFSIGWMVFWLSSRGPSWGFLGFFCRPLAFPEFLNIPPGIFLVSFLESFAFVVAHISCTEMFAWRNESMPWTVAEFIAPEKNTIKKNYKKLVGTPCLQTIGGWDLKNSLKLFVRLSHTMCAYTRTNTCLRYVWLHLWCWF